MALELLMNYHWPGNVRELENLIERLALLKRGETISSEDLPEKVLGSPRDKPQEHYDTNIQLPPHGIDLKSVISSIEVSLIYQALAKTGGNKNRASKLLKINRTTLIEKMKKKGIHVKNLKGRQMDEQLPKNRI